MNETLKDRILEVLHDLRNAEMVDIHNQYCERNNYYDDYIEYMDSLDDMCYGMKATDIIDKFGEMDTSKNYYVIGIYDVESFDYYDEAPTTYYDEIAEICAEEDEDFGCTEIRNALDEWEEEHEEE